MIPRVKQSMFSFHIKELHLNINMESVKEIRIEAVERSTFTVDDLLVLSTTWKKVEYLKIDTYNEFSMIDISTLLNNMPAIEEVDGIILRSDVTSKQFKKIVCKDFPKLQFFTWDWKKNHQRRKLDDFVSRLTNRMKEDCGIICIPKKPNDKPYFDRMPDC